MLQTPIKNAPKNDRVCMTKKRALKDPVLAKVIKYADNELALHMRVNFAPMIKKLDLGQHREFIRRHMKGVVREILEETFGPLIAVTHDGGIAGTGKGSYTTGYRRAVTAYEGLADASLRRKQGIAIGIGGAHNELASVIGSETGNARDTMEVNVVPLLEKKKEEALPLPKPKTEFAKNVIAAMFGKKEGDE